MKADERLKNFKLNGSQNKTQKNELSAGVASCLIQRDLQEVKK